MITEGCLGVRLKLAKEKLSCMGCLPECRAPHYESGDGVLAPRQPDWLLGEEPI